ncbi:putative NADH dehydrogenase [ubiquinone] 1 beta subcomplex subunit 8 [Plasmopara halstedii]
MSSQSLCHVLRNGISISARRQALITRGGHAHRPPPPPFARIQVPNQPLHEEAELVWNDGVAPETLIDFDAPHIPKFQALRHLMLGLSAFATLMGVVTLYDPNSWRQAVKRGDHLLDLKWEMGEADKPEEEMED